MYFQILNTYWSPILKKNSLSLLKKKNRKAKPKQSKAYQCQQDLSPCGQDSINQSGFSIKFLIVWYEEGWIHFRVQSA